MSTYRVRIPRDKGDFVRSLVDNEGEGPFQTYADVLAFAAALGARYNERIPVEFAAKEPGAIDIDIFISRGYDTLIKLLAVSATDDPKILSAYSTDAEARRVEIFEEYAHGGLERLDRELRGAIDPTERLLLILSQERFQEVKPAGEFDLGRFL